MKKKSTVDIYSLHSICQSHRMLTCFMCWPHIIHDDNFHLIDSDTSYKLHTAFLNVLLTVHCDISV